MPGLVGIITRMPRQSAEAELRLMLAAMRHEPNYVAATCIDESMGTYIGWTARRGTFSDGMPLANRTGTVSLIFSGEEYPSPETAGHSPGNGRTHQASYLVDAYEQEKDFPRGLNGRFHGFVSDREKKRCLLFNDRYGMHRIYYHESSEAFYFAAEAKAILAVRQELRRMDSRGVGEFVICGCVLDNRSFFQGISLLPPASAWSFSSGSSEQKATYFSPQEWEDQSELTPEEYYRAIQEVFARNLPRYFVGHENVGMSLTGGLDTRMIMAWRKFQEHSMPCYSFGGMYRECRDVSIARQVAKVCGQRHEIIPLGGEFLAQFPRYAERSVYLSDGCIDVSHSPDLYLNELAAKIAPVRMTGNYGGEVLRRVRAFKPVDPVPGLFARELSEHMTAAKASYATAIQGHPLSFAVFRQAPWHHYSLLALEQSQITVRSPFLDNDFVRTVYRAPESVCRNPAISCRLIAHGDPQLARIPTDRGFVFGEDGPVARLRRGLSTFTIKAEYGYDYGMPHWAAKVDRLLSPLHPERLFLGKNKFYHFRVWYRDYLNEYVREILLDNRTLSRSFIQRKALETMVSQHLEGTRNHTLGIHKALTLELIHRLFIDSKSTAAR